jgi:hypothetical protein
MKLRPRTHWWPVLALWMLAAGIRPALAAEESSEISPWRISGYGTLSQSWDDRGDLAAIRDFTQRPAQLQDTGPTWRMDTRLGVQLAYRFSPQIEGVIQAVARDQINTSLGSSIDLAYLDIQLAPDHALRLGRIGYAPFLMSDHRNLGYAYPWVRPPREFYSWIPIFSFDGGEFSHDIFQGDTRWRIRAQLGRSGFDIPMGQAAFDFKAADLWSLSLSRQAGPWRLQAGLSGFRSTAEAAPLAGLHAGLEQLAALNIPGISDEAAQLRGETSFRNARLRYFTLGAAYDDGQWLAQAELGYSATNKAIAPASRTGYAALARRLGEFTPYAIFSISRPVKSALAPINDWSSISQEAFQQIAYFVANSTRQDQETLSLGSRWDFDSRAALKLQWDHSRIHPQGYALWFRSPEANTRSSSVNLFTVSLDFVF